MSDDRLRQLERQAMSEGTPEAWQSYSRRALSCGGRDPRVDPLPTDVVSQPVEGLASRDRRRVESISWIGGNQFMTWARVGRWGGSERSGEESFMGWSCWAYGGSVDVFAAPTCKHPNQIEYEGRNLCGSCGVEV